MLAYLELAALCAMFLVSAFLLRRWRISDRIRKGIMDPPGPVPRFLVGNLYDFPSTDPHEGYARLAEKYGPVMQLTLPTKKVVILSTAKAAKELLDRRGAIYADRPPFPMMELMGWGFNIGLQRYGDAWRARRRLLQQHLNSIAIGKYAAVQTRVAARFASMLLRVPGDFIQHMRRLTAANILEVTYGFEIELENDPYVKLAEDAMDTLAPALVPGKYAIDWIPALKHIPIWFPGAQFKRDAAKWRKYPEAMLSAPFERVRAEMANGITRPCIVAKALARDGTAEWETVVKESAGTVYFGGADTTVSTLETFFLEMIRHPNVQRRAQEELDRVVGDERLPTFSDRPSLPYIEAIIRELLRVYPVIPLGVPHAAQEDNVYEGLLITKGTTVVANIWAILRDQSVYPNADVFNPERFLRDGQIAHNVPDPRAAFFGYGRRVCVGRHFADATLYIIVATTLACFDITKAVENGVEIEPSGKFSHTFVSAPLPFKCTIKPRSDKVESLINQGIHDLE